MDNPNTKPCVSNNCVLDAVIDITNQHDLHALEFKLVETLADLLPVDRVALYKLIEEESLGAFEEAAYVHAGETPDHGPESEPRIFPPDAMLEECVAVFEPVHDPVGNRLLVPVCNGHKVVGALEFSSNDDLTNYTRLINGLINVYCNYLFILNESERDKLTGLLNRRTFDNKLNRLMRAQQRSQQQYNNGSEKDEKRVIAGDPNAWLAMIDIDHFKSVNDIYGHLYGDEVLLLLAQKMEACFRKTDLLFRFGGEEFVVILEPTSRENAQTVMERFRETIAGISFPQIGHITVSIGYAKLSEKDFPPMIIERADKALYFAKRAGRNCTCNYEQLLADGKLTDIRKATSIDLF